MKEDEKTIEQRKHVEERLRQNEDQFQAIFYNAPIAIAQLDMMGHPLNTNLAAQKMFGYSGEELAEMQFTEFTHPDDREIDMGLFQELVAGKRDQYSMEKRYIRKDGQIIYGNLSVSLIRDEQGNPKSIIGMAIDITERKKAEEALRESEKKFRVAFKMAPNGMLIVDDDGTFLEFNDNVTKYFGYSKEELLKKSYLDITHPEDLEKSNRAMEQLSNGKLKFFSLDKRYIKKNGSIMVGHVLVSLIAHNRHLVQLEDITEKKKMEKAYQYEREFNQKLIDTASVFLAVVNDEGNIVMLNKLMMETLGYSEEEVVGKNYLSLFVPKEEHEDVSRIFEEQILKNERTMNENHVIAKDGRKLLVEWHGSSIVRPNGEIREFFGVGIDITERTLTERLLREQDERIRSIVEASLDWIWAIDVKGNHTYSNPAVVEILGYQPEELVGSSSLDHLHDDDRKGIEKQLPIWIKKKEGWNHHIIRWKHRNGSIRYLESNAVPILDPNGDLIGFRGVDRDITDRKKAEEEVRNMYELSPDLLAIIDIKNLRFKKINPAFTATLGYEEEELLASMFTDFIHPRDLEKTMCEIKEEMKGKKSATSHFENRCRCIDGTYKWISWRSRTLAEVGISYSVGRDITEQKKAEEDLKKRLMQFSMEDGTIYIELESTIDRSGVAFRDLLNVGYDGVVLSRTPEREFRKAVPGAYEFSWITSSRKSGGIPPDFPGLRKVLSGLPKRTAILFDRLDYLIFTNSFKKTLLFIHELKDLSYLNDHIIILSVDPKTLAKNEKTLIAKETNELEPIHKTTLSDDLLDVLRFVYKKSDMNVHATYVNIVQDLKISRPTARKRVGDLGRYKGYLSEEAGGHAKRFSLTTKGRQLFTQQ